jgi:tetratricopeptide (TPR) repeat protein
LETVREFAEEMLGAEQADHEMARRHAEFFLERAMSANLTADAEGAMRHDIVLRDQANIRRAIEWCRASGEFELGLRLAVALENYWSTSAPEEGRRWLSEFLDQGPDLPTALRAAARRARGGSSILLGDRALGRIEYEASLADARASGDARVTSLMLERLAIEDIVDGEVARGRARCEEGLALARSIGFGKPEAMALNILGSLERAAGHAHEGASLLQQSADLAGQVGFTWWQSSTLLELAEAYLEDGDVAAAERALLEALPLLADMADRQNTVYTLAVLARCAAEQGDLERAGWLWGAVEAEEARGRVGQWEQDRDSYAAAVLKHATAEFDTARTNGAAADLTEAIEFALGRGRGAEEGRRPRHELDRAATGQDAL